METITSLKNPKVLSWRGLKDHRGREAMHCFLVEGWKSVEEAIHSGFQCDALLLVHPMQAYEAWSAKTYLLPEYVMAAICDTKTPQGVAAVMRIREELPLGNRIVALDGVQDPGNVGTILRTADAMGMQGLILSAACADPWSPKVVRATMGSIFHVPLCVTQHLADTLMDLRMKGYSVLSSQLDGDLFSERKNVGSKYVLVIGNEGQGISEEVKAVATHRVRLPMYGRAESLNAAVAAGIMMYELIGDET